MLETLNRRPIVLAALGLLLGLTLVAYPLNFAILIAFLIWLSCHRARWIVVAAAGVGILMAPVPVQLISHRQALFGFAQVVSVPTLGEGRSSFEIEVNSKKWMASIFGPTQISLGDGFAVSGMARPWPIHLEPWARWHGLTGSIMIPPTSIAVTSRGNVFAHFATTTRLSFVSFIGQNCPTEVAAMLDALCFNVSGFLDAETSGDLRKTGLIHVVSASGFHVTIIVMALVGLGTRLPVPRLALICAVGGVLALYALATGLHAPIVRACVMSMLAMSAYLVRREPDFLSALALSLVGVLLWRPSDVFDPGLQLSYVTFGALGMVNFRTSEVKSNKFVKRTKQMVQGTMVATLASMPLVAFHFGAVSLISPVANLLIGLVIPLLVMGALGAWMLSLVSAPLATAFIQVCISPVVTLMKASVQAMAGLPGAAVRVPDFSGYAIFLLLILALWAWRPVPVEA